METAKNNSDGMDIAPQNAGENKDAPKVSFQIREGFESMDFEKVADMLATSYWAKGTTRAEVEHGSRHSSLVIGAFIDERQVGFCRVVSDRLRFAYLCDVFVEEEARGLGIAKAMVSYALGHRDHQGLRRWILVTSDAQSLYASLGFTELGDPDKWMVYTGIND